jgi:Raf kinase inhibitor-like YbhB/YbcL family protein
VRRVVLLTIVLLGSTIAAAGCNDDGRTLRPPNDRQNASISVTSAPDTAVDDPTFLDPDDPTFTLDTIPPTDTELLATAPWREGQAIDPRYTCEGANVAPALSWSAAPAGTVEIAITLTDLDAPTFAHWAIAGLAPETIALAEDTVPIGAYEANNGNGDLGYTGPCPPAGTAHTYVITVHYLGAPTGLDDGAPGNDLMLAIRAAETAFAEVSGTFSRT